MLDTYIRYVNPFLKPDRSDEKLRLNSMHRKISSVASASRKLIKEGPSLTDFIKANNNKNEKSILTSSTSPKHDHYERMYPIYNNQERGSYFLETYGCQMNVSDSEIIESILQGAGYRNAASAESASVVLLNTCAIRENAEAKIWHRLDQLKAMKRQKLLKNKPFALGLLGCMAERLKQKVLESNKSVDVVVGPDAYRDLPRLLNIVNEGKGEAVNVQLSVEETYADISPIRTDKNGVTSFLSVMRGCNNMCSFCIVPFTRGRERSRNIDSILDEIKMLSDSGYKEVTLLGQNVNSYYDKSIGEGEGDNVYSSSKGFNNLYRLRNGYGPRFADLLHKVSEIDSNMRIRFTSPHPKDFPNQVLEVIKEKANVCNSLHMPAQSGSSSVLNRMRRNYTREAYIELVQNVRNQIPNVSLSTDIISGFCGESEEEHQDTLSLMRDVKYDSAFMFAYSMRDRTHAYHKMEDDVAADIKQRRLEEVIETFRTTALEKSKREMGEYQLVLIEKESRRSTLDAKQWTGRNEANKKVIIEDSIVESSFKNVIDGFSNTNSLLKKGEYVVVEITETGVNSNKGKAVALSDITEFDRYFNNNRKDNQIIRVERMQEVESRLAA